jgi:hypothetical protein
MIEQMAAVNSQRSRAALEIEILDESGIVIDQCSPDPRRFPNPEKPRRRCPKLPR